jgi:hypothetical protein
MGSLFVKTSEVREDESSNRMQSRGKLLYGWLGHSDARQVSDLP